MCGEMLTKPRQHNLTTFRAMSKFSVTDDDTTQTLNAKLEGSLRRLGTSYLDVYLLHHDDRAAAPAGAGPGLLATVVAEPAMAEPTMAAAVATVVTEQVHEAVTGAVVPAAEAEAADTEDQYEDDFEDDDDGFFVVFLLEAANVVASMSFPKRRRKTHDAFSNELVVVVVFR